MTTLTYAYKLKPTKRQAEPIDHDLEVCRSVGNRALREHKDWIASRNCPINTCSLHSESIIPADEPDPNFNLQCQRRTKAKQVNPELASVNAQQAKLVKRASGYYLMLSFQSDIAMPNPPLVGHVVGVDVGLEYFLSTSDGLQVKRLKFFVDLQHNLKLLQRRLKQRRLKRKQIGLSNWTKTQSTVARLHEQIARTRKDFRVQQAHKLCDVADVTVIEDLNLMGSSRGMLGKHMLDAGHGQFLNSVLPWVALKRGKATVQEDEDARGSSQECPVCGAVVKAMIAVHWHPCSCGCTIPRDVASGLVLRNR